jgi:Flp pilus assembly protein TadD
MSRRSLVVAVLLASACASSRAARERGDVVGAQKDLVRALMLQGEHATAWSVIDPVCRARPRDAEALTLRGVIMRERGFPDEARLDLEEAVRLDDELAVAHSALAVLHDLEGRRDEAERHHRLAVKLEPKNPRYLNNLAFSLFTHGQARLAIPHYLEALRHDPVNRRVRNNLGFAYAVTGDWARAKRQFDAGGTPSDARVNLGYAYEKSGSLQQAFDLYLEAVRIAPASRHARESLARVAATTGRPLPADVAGTGDGVASEGGGS